MSFPEGVSSKAKRLLHMCTSSSHLLIFSFQHSHLPIFSHIFSHIFSSSHLRIFTLILSFSVFFTSSHLHGQDCCRFIWEKWCGFSGSRSFEQILQVGSISLEWVCFFSFSASVSTTGHWLSRVGHRKWLGHDMYGQISASHGPGQLNSINHKGWYSKRVGTRSAWCHEPKMAKLPRDRHCVWRLVSFGYVVRNFACSSWTAKKNMIKQHKLFIGFNAGYASYIIAGDDFSYTCSKT